jgi:phenylacetate-CoA ligase
MPPDWTAIEAARRAALSVTLDLAAVRHAPTRRKMAEAGLARADLADLARLPLTTKTELMAEPEAALLDLSGADVWDTMYTTGSTSGRPTPFVSTTSDFWDILVLQRRMLEIRGVGTQDRIANLFPLTRHPHGAFTRVLHAAAALHIPVVSALPGNPGPGFELGQELDGLVDTLARSRPTILRGVPSYMRRVVARAAERGAPLPDVRLVLVTGEGLSEEGRAELLARLTAIGARSAAVSISYGMTGIQGGLVECTAGAGLHNPHPEAIAIDVDPQTQQPLPDGEEGLIVLSHMRRRGTLLLRYAVGDLGVRSTAPCPHCGRVTERILGTPRRADELTKIRGMLVNPALAIAAVEGLATVRDFRFEIAREGALGMDQFLLRVVPEPGGRAGSRAGRACEARHRRDAARHPCRAARQRVLEGEALAGSARRLSEALAGGAHVELRHAIIGGQGGRAVLEYDAAHLHHHGAVGNGERTLHGLRDQQDRAALRRHRADGGEDLLREPRRQADGGLVQHHRAGCSPLDLHMTVAAGQQSEQCPQQRGLAGAVVAEQREHLAGGHGKADLLHDHAAAIAGRDAFGAKHRRLSQIRADDARRCLDRVRRPVLKHRALVHHDDAGSETHDEIHVVLDDQEQPTLRRMGLPQEAAERVEQAGIDGGSRLVQQQPARAYHQRRGDLQHAPLAEGEDRSGRIGVSLRCRDAVDAAGGSKRRMSSMRRLGRRSPRRAAACRRWSR